MSPKQLENQRSGKMEILVDDSDERTITVEVKPFETIGDIKIKIQDGEGIPVNQQRLSTPHGEKLEDGIKVSDYNIPKQTILYLTRRNCHGGYPSNITDKVVNLRFDDGWEIDKSTFSSLYLSLLSYWFPWFYGFEICPRWIIPSPSKRVKRSINYVVTFADRPLLLLELKPPVDFRYESKRKAAIAQVIRRFDEVGPYNQDLDCLYGISAIGEQWRAAYILKGQGSESGMPVQGIAEVTSLESAEKNCWNPDITSNASCEAFEKIANAIKASISTWPCEFEQV